MNYKWLHKHTNAPQVIVFFSGWGFDESAVSHLTTAQDTDVLFVYDYTDLNTDLPDLNHYKTRYLIAWSFGVANYALWQQNRKDIFNQKIAINGTLQAINRAHGIAEKVVQHTIDTLTVASFAEFLARCQNSSKANHTGASIDIDAKKNELTIIKNRAYESNTTIQWDTAWIGQQDKIFSTKNQQRAWQGTPINLIDTPHMPFLYWSNWQDLLA